MSQQEIDDYLAALPEPKRGTLEQLRHTILAIISDAEQGIAYGVPAFRVRGKPAAGFAAFANHLSYFPHSGSVLSELADDIVGYTHSTGTLQFAIDTPLPESLVRRLITVRLGELPDR